mmetsp:Transcript_50419/g.60771  ORF Transcript_50419/g.60771 Transcript_50419/m.60771 type:complete len:160 (-) Transcript_50419:73-552(-)
MDSNHHHIRSYSRRQRISHCIAVAVVYRIVSPSHRRITSPHRTSMNVVSSPPQSSHHHIVASSSHHRRIIVIMSRHIDHSINILNTITNISNCIAASYSAVVSRRRIYSSHLAIVSRRRIRGAVSYRIGSYFIVSSRQGGEEFSAFAVTPLYQREGKII